jgi:hypothetical protein
MAIKIFLGLNALVFIGYGLYCLALPSAVADQTGMQLSTGVATVEVRAMYGGLQTAIGLLALAGILRPAMQSAALIALAFLFFGLASGRMVGIAIDPDPGAYNFGAVAFEAVFAAIAAGLLVKSSAPPAPATRPA